MLIEEDKINIKSYKIFRANAEIRRRGVLIIVSEDIKGQIYNIYIDNEGRYVLIRIKDDSNNKITDIETGYLDPSNQNHLELMPEAINGIEIFEIFAGDLNKAQTGMEKIENVYYIKGL